jgi:hypothetical protein
MLSVKFITIEESISFFSFDQKRRQGKVSEENYKIDINFKWKLSKDLI